MRPATAYHSQITVLRAKKKKKRRNLGIYLHLHNLGLNPLSLNNASLWQDSLMLANCDSIHMENSTHLHRSEARGLLRMHVRPLKYMMRR